MNAILNVKIMFGIKIHKKNILFLLITIYLIIRVLIYTFKLIIN